MATGHIVTANLVQRQRRVTERLGLPAVKARIRSALAQLKVSLA